MPFAWNQIEPSRIGQVQKWDIPLNDWLGLKFSDIMAIGLGRAAWDFGEDLAYDEGKPEDPKILNKSFGIEGYLTFDKPMTIGRAALMRERKLEELERMSYLEGASHSWASPKAALGFIAGLAGGFAHPADLGTAFIPFVGSEAKAAGLARIGGKGLAFDVLHSGRQAIARGLIAEEAIGAGKAAAFTASMMNGVLSQAAVEIPVALQKHRNQADYTLEDSAFNILFGGVFAGVLHLAGSGVGKLFEIRMKAAAEAHERLDADTREAIFREHEDAFVEGRRPDTERIVALDEAAIRERVAFDEAAARAEAEAIIRREQGVSRDASANELLEVAQAEASRGTVAGGILGRLVDRFMGGERTVEVLEQIAALTDRTYNPNRVGPQESLAVENVFGPRNRAMQAARDAVKKARTELYQIEQVLPDILKRLEGAKGNEARQLRANASNLQAKRAELIEAIEKSAGRTEDFRPLSGDELAGHQMAIDSRPSLVEKAQAERARRVSEYVDKKRKDWEATMEGRLSAERRAEIARQQEQGKLLPDDELAKYQAKPKVDAADVEMVMADVATLEKEIKDMMDSMPESAEKESIKAEIDALMAKREDLSPSENESFKPLSDERISAIIETSGTKSGEPELNFRKFIDSLSDTSEPLKRLLQWVADRIDVPVIVHAYEPTRFQGRYVESGTGRAWIDIHTKLKNGKNVSEKMLSRIVAHEAIHRLVTSKLNSSPHGERMGYLFSVAKSAAKASGFEHRGLESISEFISEAMSSKKMRDFLAKTEVPVSFKTDAFEDKIKNLWNGFISAVRSAIGIDGKTVKTSVLEEVVGLSDEIAASQRVATSTFIYVDQSPMVKAAAPCASKFNG